MNALLRHRFVFALAALLCLAGLAFGCAIKEPTAKIEDVTVADVTTKNVKLNFIIGLKNPNPMGVTVKKLAYTLQVFEKTVVRDETKQAIKIPAKANVNFKMPVNLKYSDLLEAGINAIGRGKLDYTLALKITLETPVGDLTLPAKKSGTVKVKSLEDLFGIEQGQGKGIEIPFDIPAGNLSFSAQ